MASYRKRPNIVDAFQWHMPHDRPDIIKPYRDPAGRPLLANCDICDSVLGLHGWLVTHAGGVLVCRGDWIVTEQDGRQYTCRPHEFELDFEVIDDG